MSRTVMVIQARMTSSRLPGKVLMPLNGTPALAYMIQRLQGLNCIDEIVVATTHNEADEPIVDLCENMGVSVFKGSENNVLFRVVGAMRKAKADIVVEVTSDCPFLDPQHVLEMVHLFKGSDIDFMSNIETRSFPRGFDIRICTMDALEKTFKEVDNDVDRQHVLTWMYLNPKGKEGFTRKTFYALRDEYASDINVTLDTIEDYDMLNEIARLGSVFGMQLSCAQILNLISVYPNIYKKVAEIKRKDYFEELDQEYAERGDEWDYTKTTRF